MRGVAAGAAVLALASAGLAAAQDMNFFRIGTGGTGGTYFLVGRMIANSISNPPGSRPCEEGGACGVPGLVATAVATNAAAANIAAVADGSLEASLTQSDVAYWAYTGTGVFEGRGRMEKLAAIANLYPETIHLVARKGAGIRTIADLKGKRVSLDEPGSGTLIDTLLILGAYGLAEKDIEAEYLKPDAAGERLRDRHLDAFFFVGGHPVDAITELSRSLDIELVPITGRPIDDLLSANAFFAKDMIQAGTYEGQTTPVPTISVSAILVTSTDRNEELIYGVTKALWNRNTRRQLDDGHAKGRLINKETATDNIAIPLHPGAERYYRESGLLQGP